MKTVFGVEIDPENLPRHVAMIMDGNGRWAKSRGLDRVKGHEKGYEVLKEIIESNREIGVPYISVFAFSTENWNRPAAEVQYLMSLAKKLVGEYSETLLKNDIRLLITGSRERLGKDLLKSLDDSVAKTAHCKSYTLNMAFNYGGRREILDAAKSLSRELSANPQKEVTESDFSKYLYHPDVPDVDLLVRTSGEMRISNFMLWQCSYSEFFFTEKLWPDFTPGDFCEAINDYQKRQRRYGGLK